ncbi:DUF58 domain-containing protein [uncultured Bacteroides sp.]|uniref:DUF58 domain-containing protein n=1 Tax=uncultured Bacteroides sp. TaxID=162156 RepID=UPI002AAABD53|nr:DUF58 domain-containing protein [uncultured Bacteroides sp.]
MFLTRRFYIIALLIIVLLGGGYFFMSLFVIGQLLLILFICILFLDGLLLYRNRGVGASRQCAERFSNGDENIVKVTLWNNYPFTVQVRVIDEAPPVFQKRDLLFSFLLPQSGSKTLSYSLYPVKRGEYQFGHIRVFVSSFFMLIERRFTCGEEQKIKIYPSFLMLRRYELMAMTNNLTDLGIKRVRRVGQHTEFEQIKEYVKGDDYRMINWKASARKHQLMVNTYQDERSQQIYCVVDKGRVMQQAFGGMTFLDYSINASLVLSYVAMRKGDKAGLVTFNQYFDTFLPASAQSGQLQRLLEILYDQKTSFGESDFSALCAHLSKRVSKRSFLVLYTNFDSMNAMKRQLQFLRLLASRHCLLVVIFEDMELQQFIDTKPQNTEEYYQQVIADKFAFDKRLIISTLKQNGIYALLTTPNKLSIDVINKYLEMKSLELL